MPLSIIFVNYFPVVAANLLPISPLLRYTWAFFKETPHVFIALYEMTAKHEHERDFEIAWAAWTDAIHRVRGSLGSRLHRSGSPRVYVAYAQWPSAEAYQKEYAEALFTSWERNARDLMIASCENIKTVYELEVVDDRWRQSSQKNHRTARIKPLRD